jgi:hypothetical protein
MYTSYLDLLAMTRGGNFSVFEVVDFIFCNNPLKINVLILFFCVLFIDENILVYCGTFTK